MKPSNTLTLAIFVASLAFGSALAEPVISPDDLSAQTATNDAKAHGGFSTKARVALWWGASKILRSVNVSGVTSPLTGVYCITPSVKLNFSKIYPQVTAEASLTTGSGFWAYAFDTPNNPTFCSATQLEVITRSLVGTTVQDSNQVSFYLVVE